MTDPLSKFATATEIAGAVMSKKVKASAVIDATLKRIAAAEPTVNAFTDIVAERARKRAAEIDAGNHRGPLMGVPFAVKNLFDIAGLPTRAGSKINVDGPKAARDGALVRKLEAAGAILVGGLNMGEYAYDFTGENAHYGPSRNPRDTTRMSGGSSGGSGAAVASGEVPLALGSDTNGSIRVPSSLCGLFGLKPTYGRLSRAGSFPFVDAFDHLGPIARSAEDLALSFDAMQGWDPDDPVCTDRPSDPTLPRLIEGIDGLRIAIAGDYFARGGEPEAFEAVATVAKALGASKTVVLPQAAAARAAAYVITAIEGGQLHLPRLRARPQDFDPDTRERFMAGALLPGAWYVKAQRFRRHYRANVLKIFDEADIVLAPATPCTAPKLGQVMMKLGGVDLPVRANLGLFTQPISFIGLPVVVAPLQRPGGLPIGVQLIAKPYNEQAALRVAAFLEKQGIAAAPPA
ncbi:MAG: AtzE family amidohydrolase [Reyranella sp.]|uniref:AtzE family amidohydrolase n=1 Tax=Reyranella sp. TaxID=1929291 RepID=UPI00120991EC|nr:AtzE family amidohydrolase [Reyranella sp.]TAJ38579.1 MAG: AtzE family amidohydrolase [Reyranella sp.]